MKTLKLFTAALAVVAGPALGNDIPVPSFNDAPDIYGHEAFGKQARQNASRGALGPVDPGPMDYAPWVVIPSSGA